MICETLGFPRKAKLSLITEAYFDRLESWDLENTRKAYALLKGTGSLPYALPALTKEKLCEFAQILFKLDKPPVHVRVIYYYNVSTGYDCPHIIAVKSE